MPAFYLQDHTLLSVHSVRASFDTTRYATDLVEQMDQIEVGSVPIIIVALACVGGVVVLNAASQFVRFGGTVLTGDALSLSLLRELGPVFTALLVAGRNSTGMASQLGSMLVTEQVDAIRGLGIDPIRKLMTPRVLAAVLILPLLVAIGDCAGLFGRFIVATVTQHIDAQEFWTRAINALAVGDLVIGFSKPVVLGFILATVGCYQGYASKAAPQAWAALRSSYLSFPHWPFWSRICSSHDFCFTHSICEILCSTSVLPVRAEAASRVTIVETLMQKIPIPVGFQHSNSGFPFSASRVRTRRAHLRGTKLVQGTPERF